MYGEIEVLIKKFNPKIDSANCGGVGIGVLHGYFGDQFADSLCP